MAKVGPELIGAWQEYRDVLTSRGAAAAAGFRPGDRLLHLTDGDIQIEAYTQGSAATLARELGAIGAKDVQPYGNGVSALLPAADIKALAALPDLTFARPAWYTLNSGSVTSQGDPAIRGDVGRGTFGIDGTGVKVGVLSDSFDTGPGSYAADVASGDLPPGVQVLTDSSNGTDEGRAMAQLVHDTAPGAALAFDTANGGQQAFANHITALRDAGCKVIVDDVSYFAEPMFQDGVVAQAVDNVVTSGVSYFSAAGNEANQSYASAFRTGVSRAQGSIAGVRQFKFRGGVTHDFDPGPGVDDMQAITLAAGQSITLSFQWDQPFGSISSSANHPATDLDIYLLNAAGTQVVAGSASNNAGTGLDPVEVFGYTNNGSSAQTYQLMIVKFGTGPDPGLIKYIDYNNKPVFTEWDTGGSTVFGHANAAGAAAVAAAAYFDTPAFGVSPPQVEPYSSLGGTPILFDTAGNRLGSSVTRNSPAFTAPDGGNTTFFYGDDGDPDTFPNFYGTSAAAPAAASVAALMLQLAPSMSPASVYSTLQGTAQDMSAAGYDFSTGSGLIRADAAIASMLGITAAGGSAYQVTGPAGSRLLSISAGTVTLGRDLSAFYPGISLSVSGEATAVFAVDQAFADVTLAGEATISVGQSPAGASLATAGALATSLSTTSGQTPAPTAAAAPTSTGAASQRSLVLKAVAAGYARDGAYGGTDFSPESGLVVTKGPVVDNRESFLTFDLSKLGPIHTAHLRLFGSLSGDSPEAVRVALAAASGTWAKGRLTWNYRPTASAAALATTSISGAQGRWYDWDLTAFLKAQPAAGKSAVTLALRGVSATEAAALFDSGEAGKAPRVIVT